jgi:predicted phage gp36 major capsid-like protein
MEREGNNDTWTEIDALLSTESDRLKRECKPALVAVMYDRTESRTELGDWLETTLAAQRVEREALRAELSTERARQDDSDSEEESHAKDNVSLMKKMSCEIDRLEAELRSATLKATRRKWQAKAYKQKAEAHKQEAEALKSDLARVKATLAEKLEAEVFEQMQCTVCIAAQARVVALPCGHRCFCTNAECSAHVSLCPLCRTPMPGTLRIY